MKWLTFKQEYANGPLLWEGWGDGRKRQLGPAVESSVPSTPTPIPSHGEIQQARGDPLQHNSNSLILFVPGWGRSPSRAQQPKADQNSSLQTDRQHSVSILFVEETIYLGPPCSGPPGSPYRQKGKEQKAVSTGILPRIRYGLLSRSLLVFMLFLKRGQWEIRSIAASFRALGISSVNRGGPLPLNVGELCDCLIARIPQKWRSAGFQAQILGR